MVQTQTNYAQQADRADKKLTHIVFRAGNCSWLHKCWSLNKCINQANNPNDLEKYFIERANAGDVEGIVALYESDAIVSDGKGEVAIGLNQIREFFVKFLANRPQFDPSVQAEALCSGNIALTSSRTSNGDITAEVARRQSDGSWLWVVDQFALGDKK